MRSKILDDRNVHDLFLGKDMARQSLAPKTTLLAPEFDLGPTKERRHHATIERVARPIGDEAGRSARPYRAVDTLVAMERRGTITAGMRQAAEDFRAQFVAAQLDPLHALDYSCLRYSERGRGNSAVPAALRAESAREDVWRAIAALGGPGSSRRVMCVARRRLGTLDQGMGA